MVVEGSHGNRGLLPSSTSVRLLIIPALPGTSTQPMVLMLRKERAMDVVHPRCAGVDISKRDAKVCVRIAGAGRTKAKSTVTTWGAVTNQVLALRDHLVAEQVTLVVMEATSDYWKPFYYLLEAGPFEVMLVNARHVKNLPGRTTDVSDAAWLAQLGAHGLVRGSFVPPEPIRQLRDLTRTRSTLVRAGPRRSNGWRNCWRTPASNCRRWPLTSVESRAGPCSKLSSTANVTQQYWLIWPNGECDPRSPSSPKLSPDGSASTTGSWPNFISI